MTKVAVLDDWQDVARSSADWSPLSARAEVVFFAQAFDDEGDAAAKLADFDIVLSMSERTALPGSLISRLPKLRMLGITGARNASLDTRPAPRAAFRYAARPAAQAPGRPGRTGAGPAAGSGAGDSRRGREYAGGTISGRLARRHQPGGKDHRDHRTRPPRIGHGRLTAGR